MKTYQQDVDAYLVVGERADETANVGPLTWAEILDMLKLTPYDWLKPDAPSEKGKRLMEEAESDWIDWFIGDGYPNVQRWKWLGVSFHRGTGGKPLDTSVMFVLGEDHPVVNTRVDMIAMNGDIAKKAIDAMNALKDALEGVEHE